MGALAAGLALAGVVPLFVTDRIWQGVIVLALIDGTIVLGLTVLFGFCGQISLAQATFAGVGAYSLGITTTRWGWSPWWALGIAPLVSGTLAYLLGVPILRVRGYYLAVATLAVNIVMVTVANEMVEYTQGPSGFGGIPPLVIAGHSIFEPADFYYVAAAGFFVAFVICRGIIRSPLGLQLSAVGRDEDVAAVCGIHVPRLKVRAFVLSASIAAIGGYMQAAYLLTISPRQFSILPSATLVMMLVIGGMRSVWGALAGALFVHAVPELLAESPDLQPIVFASAFLFTLMVLPDGIVGIPSRAWQMGTQSWEKMRAVARQGRT